MMGTGRLARCARGLCGAGVITSLAGAVACGKPATLTQLVEAQGLASALHVAFTRSVESGNRVVMIGDDDAAGAAANETRQSIEAVERHMKALQDVLQSLAYHSDLKHLDAFRARFEEYRHLSDEVLSLIVENTNVKAQRLSFGPASEAAEAFHAALESAVKRSPAAPVYCAGEQAARAWAAVLEIQGLHARHIAEPEDAEMSRMESRMNASAAAARAALQDIASRTPDAGAQLAAARTALDRFLAVHVEIVDLSRRNSNVRALALSLGRRRTVAADADALLTALQEALAEHEFGATR